LREFFIIFMFWFIGITYGAAMLSHPKHKLFSILWAVSLIMLTMLTGLAMFTVLQAKGN